MSESRPKCGVSRTSERSLSRGALLAFLFALGCASSVWERTEKVSSNGDPARLYVPKLYAPLRPGSVYPDKRKPVAAAGRPSVAVVCSTAASCPKDRILGPLAERGIVVLLFESAPKEPPGKDKLRTRAESTGAPTGWLLISPTADFLGRCMVPGAAPAVVAVLAATPFPDPPSKKILGDVPREPVGGASFGSSRYSPSEQVFNGAPRRVLLEALNGSEARISFEGAIEKLYAPDASGRLPREAYRDAVEWLAGELGAR